MAIEQHRRYHATVRLRRGDGFVVKPEAESSDGVSAEFFAAWLMTDDDTSLYVGEWAMIPIGDAIPQGWVASGDLVDLRPSA
jgi:hypothetical protein